MIIITLIISKQTEGLEYLLPSNSITKTSIWMLFQLLLFLLLLLLLFIIIIVSNNIRSRGEEEERNCDGELIVSPTLRSPNAELPTLFVARQSQRDRVAINRMVYWIHL